MSRPQDARVGVVGATGAVGRVALDLLAERGYEHVRAFASARSAGARVRYGGGELTVEEATPEALAAGDLDERGERLRRDPRMALHPGADDADLPEVVARAPRDAEPVERRMHLGSVCPRSREHDLGPRLDDRVDVDARAGERGEELRGGDAGDAVHVLLGRVRDARDHRLLQHPVVLLGDPGAARLGERRADVQPDAVVARELDRA